MSERRPVLRGTAGGALAALMVFALAGCPDDPHDSSTWIDKLDDKAELERAVTELSRLKDPDSIKPLGEAWERENRPARILRVVIDIADQRDKGTVSKKDPKFYEPDPDDPNPDKAKRKKIFIEERYKAEIKRVYGPKWKDESARSKTGITDLDKSPFWGDAIPFLVEAVEEWIKDDNNKREMDNAQAALDALALAKEHGHDVDPDVIVRAAKHPLPLKAKGNLVRVTALRALGRFPESVDTLIGELEKKPEDLSGLKPKERAVQMQVQNMLFAAAADALAHARDPKAIPSLIYAMYEKPLVYQFCRRSLVAIGEPAIDPLIKVFLGKDPKLNKLAKENKFFKFYKSKSGEQRKCQKADNSFVKMGPKTSCTAPTNLEYKAAKVLGDLRAVKAIPHFEAELKKQPLPAFFIPQGGAQVPGPSQHQAIFESLKKIASPKAADAVLAYAKDPSSDDYHVPMAIDTFSYMGSDPKVLAYLAGIMSGKIDRDGKPPQKGDVVDPRLRIAAGLVYGRLAVTKEHVNVIKKQVKEHRDEAEKWTKTFETKSDELEKFDKKNKYEAVKKAYDAYIKKQGGMASLRKNAKKFNQVKKYVNKKWGKVIEPHQKLESEKFDAEGRMNDNISQQRTYEQNLARALVGQQCKGKPKCMIEFVEKSPNEIATALKSDIKGVTKWKDEEKKTLWIAAVERAFLDLAKLGQKANEVEPDLLRILASATGKEPFVREGILLSLPKVAKLPCTECVKVLTAVIKEQEGQETLKRLTGDARVERHYYRWAK